MLYIFLQFRFFLGQLGTTLNLTSGGYRIWWIFFLKNSARVEPQHNGYKTYFNSLYHELKNLKIFVYIYYLFLLCYLLNKTTVCYIFFLNFIHEVHEAFNNFKF